MITILDGGMGRELERRGAPFRQPEWSALALMEAPEAVRAVHDDFIAAGAEVITTNSYACVPFHIGTERFAERGRELIGLAARLARDSANSANSAASQKIKVAGCLPPLFGSYNPDFFESAHADEILIPLIEEQAPYVDFWLIETVSSVEEGLYIVNALKDTGKPIWVSFTLDDHAATETIKLRSGRPLTEALAAVQDEPIEAVLFNCSRPETITPAIAMAVNLLGSRLRIGAYANAFADEIETGHDSNEVISSLRKDLSEDTAPYCAFAEKWITDGATIIGGCCGISPAHINAVNAMIKHFS